MIKEAEKWSKNCMCYDIPHLNKHADSISVVDLEFLNKLENEMRRLVELDLPIIRSTISLEEACKIYSEKKYSRMYLYQNCACTLHRGTV